MKLEPVYIDNIGSVDCAEKAIKVTYGDCTFEFSYRSYLKSLYKTREDLIEDEIRSDNYNHYESLVEEKIVGTLAPIYANDKGLHDLLEPTVWHYFNNDNATMEEADATFDEEKSHRSAKRRVTHKSVAELNMTTAHDLIAGDPDEFTKFYIEQTKIPREMPDI